MKGMECHLELSRGTTIAAEIDQIVVDLQIEINFELVLSHYHCHGRGSSTRSDDLEVDALPLC